MDVVVPDLGDFSDVDVIEVLVKPGDAVEPEDALITLETEKASMDVPSPVAGVVKELKVTQGDRVSTGDLILRLQSQEEQKEETEHSGTDRPQDEDHPSQEQDERADPQLTRAQDQGTEASDVFVPDLGDFAEVDVIEVLVKVGDTVQPEDALITLETEKATMDVPSPAGGVIQELAVAVGDQVSAGDLIARLKRAQGESPVAGDSPDTRSGEELTVRQPRPAPPHDAVRQPVPPSERLPPVDEAGFTRAHASPSVRKLARELGADLARVSGTGRKGRITADDLKAFVKRIVEGGGAGALPSLPDVDFAKFGEVTIEPLGRIQRISGPRLQASWLNVPHVTQHDEADITELEAKRQSLKAQASERGIRLTPLAFVIRATVLALAEFPRFASSLAADQQSLVFKHYRHIGFAADTPNGLMVPVIRNADKMDVYELAERLARLSEQARDGKLSLDDMQGGVFTISSLGGIGGTAFTPIVNAPEVAILGVSRHQWRPAYQNDEFVPRLILPFSLSYDHRVIDGAQAVRFTTFLSEALSQVERLLEAIP